MRQDTIASKVGRPPKFKTALELAKAWGMDIVEQQKREMQTKELKPFVKNHVLVSYPLDLHEKVMELVQSLIGVEGVEIEQSAN